MTDNPQSERDIIKSDSRFLHGEDLERDGVYVDVTLTIKSVGAKDSALSVDKRQIPGWPLTFEGTPKIWVLNAKVNQRLGKVAMGSNVVADWVGKKITLFPVTSGRYKWFGDPNTLGIRILVPEGVSRSRFPIKQMGFDLRGKRVDEVYEGEE